jgi:hypothetical protein
MESIRGSEYEEEDVGNYWLTARKTENPGN